MSETAGLIVGMVLTLCVYSYIFGDNAFYRLAVHVLVGVSAGYAAVVAFTSVILPTVLSAAGKPPVEILLALVPFVLGLFLLFPRQRPLMARLNNVGVAVLVGIGAAVALVGALAGTLIPQATAVVHLPPLWGLATALLTVCALLYFHFTLVPEQTQVAGVPVWQRVLGGMIGRGVLMITFGVLFAQTLSTSLILLTSQFGDIYQFINLLLG